MPPAPAQLVARRRRGGGHTAPASEGRPGPGRGCPGRCCNLKVREKSVQVEGAGRSQDALVGLSRTCRGRNEITAIAERWAIKIDPLNLPPSSRGHTAGPCGQRERRGSGESPPSAGLVPRALGSQSRLPSRRGVSLFYFCEGPSRGQVGSGLKTATRLGDREGDSQGQG